MAVTKKVKLQVNIIFFLIIIRNDICAHICLFYSHALVILNPNILSSPLHWHLFSSLTMCSLLQGRDNNISPSAIANNNDPINSCWTKSSPTLHFFLFQKAISDDHKKWSECNKLSVIGLCEWNLNILHIYSFKTFFSSKSKSWILHS